MKESLVLKILIYVICYLPSLDSWIKLLICREILTELYPLLFHETIYNLIGKKLSGVQANF